MAVAELSVSEYMRLIPAVEHAPQGFLWSTYDKEADVLYVNFRKPCNADDSELTEDDVIVRYQKGEVVGYTFLNASKRAP